MLATRELDIALAPVAALMDQGGGDVAAGVAIGCHGPVHSVIVAFNGQRTAINRVIDDPESRTSNLLARIVFTIFFGQSVLFEPNSAESSCQLPAARSGQVLIGDRAIEFRKNHPEAGIIDLGEEWTRATGLPFVFALWIAAHGTKQPA
jgi:predicted solute-binding protein